MANDSDFLEKERAVVLGMARRDPRTRFAIWCWGEGWCPSHGTVETFATFEDAARRRDLWQVENMLGSYKIMPVPAP